MPSGALTFCVDRSAESWAGRTRLPDSGLDIPARSRRAPESAELSQLSEAAVARAPAFPFLLSGPPGRHEVLAALRASVITWDRVRTTPAHGGTTPLFSPSSA